MQSPKRKHKICWIGIVAAAIGLIIQSCSMADPIKLGFSGELTGRHAELGVQGRNGAILAVESINAEGGISGRPIDLIVHDDKGKPEGARSADRALIDAGVVAIIGHMTSGQSVAALPVCEKAGVLMLSPTTSTSRLTGIDDHFLRIQPTITSAAGGLARLARNHYSSGRIAIIADQDNQAYTQAFQKAFTEVYLASGGTVSITTLFASSSRPDFGTELKPIFDRGSDGLLVIASARDTAFIAQHARLNGFSAPIFSSGWAQTGDLIHNGGQAVEGLIMVADYDTNSQAPEFEAFTTRYQERFGRPPTFAAAQAYEAVMVLSTALERTSGRKKGLKKAVLNNRNFSGLVGEIAMDPYGDVVRTQFVVTVKNGRFETLSPLASLAKP